MIVLYCTIYCTIVYYCICTVLYSVLCISSWKQCQCPRCLKVWQWIIHLFKENRFFLAKINRNMHSNISCIWCFRPLAKAGGFQNVDILRSPPPSPTLPATSSWNRRDPWMLPCVFFPKASRRSSPGDPLRRSWPSGLHVASGMDMSRYMEDASCFIFTYSISTVGVTFFVFFFFIASIDLSALRDVSILNGRSSSCLYI